MKKNKVAFDVDGVLVDFMSFLYNEGEKYLQKKYNTKDIVMNLDQNSFEKIFDVDSNIEKEFYKRNLIKYIHLSKSNEFAADIINELRKKNIEIHIVTSRYKCHENSLMGLIMRTFLYSWLKRNEIEYDYIKFCTFENSAIDKVEYCLLNDISLIVEDTKENISELSKYIKVLCINELHNEGVENDNITRIYKKDFHHIYEEVLNNFNIPSDHKYERVSHELIELLTKEELDDYYSNVKKYYKSVPHLNSKKETIKQEEKNLSVIYKPASLLVNNFKKTEVYNIDKIDSSASNIYIANHITMYDSFKLIELVAKNNRKTHLLTKSIRMNYLYKLLGCIEVNDRDYMNIRNSILNLAYILDEKGNVIIFPEGTRNKQLKAEFNNNDLSLADINRNLLTFKYGAFILAKALKKDIIPIGIAEIDSVHYFNVGDKIVEEDYKDHVSLRDASKEIIGNLIYDNRIKSRK